MLTSSLGLLLGLLLASSITTTCANLQLRQVQSSPLPDDDDVDLSGVQTRNSGKAKTPAIAVFGDSWSDDCNAFRLRADPVIAAQYPFPQCPPRDVYLRSTGGYIWPEYLRTMTGVPLVNFAHRQGSCSNDYALRRHRLFNGSWATVPAADDQIELFREYTRDLTDNHVYTALIFVGVNDLDSYFQNLEKHPVDNSFSLNSMVQVFSFCVLKQVDALAQMGVKRIVIMNTAPLDRVPGYSPSILGNISSEQALKSRVMSRLVNSSNDYQSALLPWYSSNSTTTSKTDTSDVSLFLYDTHAFFTSILDNPPQEAYGPNPRTTEWCASCADPQRYFFFNQMHPSVTTTKLLAQDVALFLNLTST